MKVTNEAFWLMTPCVLVGDDMHEVCFHLTLFYTYQTARYHNREDRSVNMHVYWLLKTWPFYETSWQHGMALIASYGIRNGNHIRTVATNILNMLSTRGGLPAWMLRRASDLDTWLWNHTVYEITWKNTVEAGKATDDNIIRCTRFSCYIN